MSQTTTLPTDDQGALSDEQLSQVSGGETAQELANKAALIMQALSTMLAQQQAAAVNAIRNL